MTDRSNTLKGNPHKPPENTFGKPNLSRRNVLLAGTTLVAASAFGSARAQTPIESAVRPNFGPPEGRFFRLCHDGGLVAPA